jgi:predicted GNAT superfamily acetyltransferase
MLLTMTLPLSPSPASITYHELATLEDFEQVFALEQSVWGMSPGECVPVSMLVSIVGSGGVLIGARDAQTNALIGAACGMPARRGSAWWLWSYMAGVSPAYQGRGVGFGLKQAQRAWALSHRYDTIKWTFDPMQRRNANFNFMHLGVIADTYYVNRYGAMQDALNVGLDSDRLEVTWNLLDARVIALAAGSEFDTPPQQTVDVSAALPLLYEHGDGEISLMKFPKLRAEPLLAQIPADLAALKRDDLDKARRWQLLLREGLLWAFERRYTVQAFVVHEGRCYYVLHRQKFVPKPLPLSSPD